MYEEVHFNKKQQSTQNFSYSVEDYTQKDEALKTDMNVAYQTSGKQKNMDMIMTECSAYQLS